MVTKIARRVIDKAVAVPGMMDKAFWVHAFDAVAEEFPTLEDNGANAHP